MFLAIDPGQVKCGWALVEEDGKVIGQGIWTRDAVARNLSQLASRWPIGLIILGNRTGHRGLLMELKNSASWQGTICLVEEDRSSEEARQRCVRETTRGWRRLLPVSLRFPTVPYDDYVAVILAERYLRARNAEGEIAKT